MKEQKKYSREYKEEALKLVEKNGCKNASEELGISYNTLYGWVKAARNGELHLAFFHDLVFFLALLLYLFCLFLSIFRALGVVGERLIKCSHHILIHQTLFFHFLP